MQGRWAGRLDGAETGTQAPILQPTPGCLLLDVSSRPNLLPSNRQSQARPAPTRHQGDVTLPLVRRHQLRQVPHASWGQVCREHPGPALPRSPCCRHPAAAVPNGPNKQAARAAGCVGRQRHHSWGLGFGTVAPHPSSLDACSRRLSMHGREIKHAATELEHRMALPAPIGCQCMCGPGPVHPHHSPPTPPAPCTAPSVSSRPSRPQSMAWLLARQATSTPADVRTGMLAAEFGRAEDWGCRLGVDAAQRGTAEMQGTERGGAPPGCMR